MLYPHQTPADHKQDGNVCLEADDVIDYLALRGLAMTPQADCILLTI